MIFRNRTEAGRVLANQLQMYASQPGVLVLGIPRGGGLTLLRLIDAVNCEEKNCAGDERTGLLILRRALEAPTRQIAENSTVDGGVVVD